ncbi:MAG TPA: flavodoxin [Firmicutes bacterium]|nr:flavodoxin [Bacillota bacterium]
MHILIAYASKFGCTAKCARVLKEKLKEAEVTVVDLSNGHPDNLAKYDAIVVGGPVYAGKLLAPVQKFCEENEDTLGAKRLALFLCCGDGGRYEAYLNDCFGQRLREHAVACEHFGYEYHMEKMGFIFRTVVRLVARVKHSESHILESNIARLAGKLL